MAAQVALTLNALTYAPSGVRNGTAVWDNKDVSAAFPKQATLSVSSSSNKEGNFKISSRITLPVVKTADSACGCAGELAFKAFHNATDTIPASMSAADRLAFYTTVKDYYASLAYSVAIQNLEPVW